CPEWSCRPTTRTRRCTSRCWAPSPTPPPRCSTKRLAGCIPSCTSCCTSIPCPRCASCTMHRSRAASKCRPSSIAPTGLARRRTSPTSLTSPKTDADRLSSLLQFSFPDSTMANRRGLALDGVLLLDKPVGLSSNHALQRARRSMDAAKAGHTGTLDPFATGLLVCCMGRATKISGAMLDADKAYRATLQFGEETDSGDLTGNVTARAEGEVTVNEAALLEVL